MKVLMVSNYFESHGGGIELVSGNLFRGLAQNRCEVLWAASDGDALPAKIECGNTLPLRTWNGVENWMGVPIPIPWPSAFFGLRSALRETDVLVLQDCLYLSNIAAFSACPDSAAYQS